MDGESTIMVVECLIGGWPSVGRFGHEVHYSCHGFLWYHNNKLNLFKVLSKEGLTNYKQ